MNAPITEETYSFLPPTSDKGTLGVMHLKRYWHKLQAKKDGRLPSDALSDEWTTDTTLLNTVGLGLEQAIKHILRETEYFEQFENWVLQVNKGALPLKQIETFNAQLSGNFTAEDTPIPEVLSKEDLEFWNEHGYIILRNAVAVEDCDNTIVLMCEHLGIERHNPETWYRQHPDRQGIMVQLFQHPQLQKNRETPVIRMAFEQLWGRKDILVNTDRVGFNPPETDTYKFPGPKLHWDVSLDLPIPFGLQGILYLSDTAENQGAFTLVPGFQNHVEQWIKGLPPGTNPRTQDMYALGHKPIAANAGDFIIWHHALPHGSSPNTSKVPRFVQYFVYQPIDAEVKKKWI